MLKKTHAPTRNLKIFKVLKRLHNIFALHRLQELCHPHQAAKQRFAPSPTHYQHVLAEELSGNRAGFEHAHPDKQLPLQTSIPPSPGFPFPDTALKSSPWIVSAGPARGRFQLPCKVPAAGAELCPTHGCGASLRHVPC